MAPPVALILLRFPAMLLAVMAVSGTIGWATSEGSATPPLVAHRRATTRSANGPPRLPRGWSHLAVAHGTALAVYRSPRARHVMRTFTNSVSAGAPLTLLVHHSRTHWYQVYLPTRPDGAKAWVRASDVKLVTTAYSLTVELGSHSLLLAAAGHLVRRFSIGVGQSVTPTPVGTYFITELLKQPDPNGLYGPYAFGLSAYSGVLKHFGQGGDGQIGIHGTDQPELVGTDVSHGCIRLRNPDIVWLIKRLPLGTPVRISRA